MTPKNPSDELNDRLKKARDRARQKLDGVHTHPKTDKAEDPPTEVPRPEAFVEYGTIFKLEDRDKTRMTFDPSARGIVCLNCSALLPLDIYLSSHHILSTQCRSCKMTAKEYWAGKLHREIDDA